MEKNEDYDETNEDLIREFMEKQDEYFDKGYDFELGEIIDKQPKFNLNKIKMLKKNKYLIANYSRC